LKTKMPPVLLLSCFRSTRAVSLRIEGATFKLLGPADSRAQRGVRLRLCLISTARL